MKPIKTTSFHYRYYCWVRRMLGVVEEPQTTSLCPYVQTMLCGSVVCVFSVPGVVAGWIFMKLGRILCKFQNPVTDTIIEFLKSKTGWIERLDEGPTDFSKSPVVTGLTFTVFGVGVIVCGALALGATGSILGLLGYGLWNIVDIIVWLFGLATWILANIFMIFYWLGHGLHSIYSGTIWLFTNGSLWYSIGAWIVWFLAWVLGVGVMSLVLCVLFIGISKLPGARRFGRFLTNKFNGYGEAQKARELRKAEAVKRLSPWKCEYCKYNSNPAAKSYCVECSRDRPKIPAWVYLVIFYPFEWLLVAVANFGNKSRKIDFVGPLGIIWTYIVAMKRGVCPIVEFVDPVQLQVSAQASAQERMDRETAEKTDDETPDKESTEGK